jgi:hypothetical protein
MARVRNIAPGFFTNEQLVELPFEDRLLFAGLWTLADREGRLEDRPKRIRMAIFPCDNVDVDLGLQRLQQASLVLRYTVQGVGYLAIPAFHKHQKPHPREAASVIPSPKGSPKADPPPPCIPPEGSPKANLGPPSNPHEGSPKADLGEPKADLGDGEPGGLSDSRTLGLSENDSLPVVDACDAREDDGPRLVSRTIPAVPKDWAEWASWWQAERGVETTVRDRTAFVPLATRWVKAGITTRQMRRALQQAEALSQEPIAYLPAYVDRVLANAQAPPRTTALDEQAEVLHRITGGFHGRAPTDPRTIDVDSQPEAPRIATGGG